MLTRFVRIQLILFLVASVIGVGAMIFGYMQVPTMLGIGRVMVKLDLPETGGSTASPMSPTTGCRSARSPTSS